MATTQSCWGRMACPRHGRFGFRTQLRGECRVPSAATEWNRLIKNWASIPGQPWLPGHLMVLYACTYIYNYNYIYSYVYMHACMCIYIYYIYVIYVIYVYVYWYLGCYWLLLLLIRILQWFFTSFVVYCVKLVCIFLGYAWLTLLLWNDAPANLIDWPRCSIALRWVGAPKISRCLLRKTLKFEGFSIGSIYVSTPTPHV
jgi:hypothetical protein